MSEPHPGPRVQALPTLPGAQGSRASTRPDRGGVVASAGENPALRPGRGEEETECTR